MEFNYGVPRYQVIPQINTQVIPQINTQVIPQINTQVIPQRNVQIIPQINAQTIPQKNIQVIPRMDTQMNAQMMIKPNYFCNINGQNNFFNQNMTNQTGNLQISPNIGYYNNGNMTINQNQLEKEKKVESLYVKFIFGSLKRMITIQTFPDEKLSKLIEKYRKVSGDHNLKRIFVYNSKNLNLNLTCGEFGISEGAIIKVINTDEAKGGAWYNKEINIKFIKVSKHFINIKDNKEIIGLLKLCLLKEISKKISEDKLKVLPDIVYYILKILLNGNIEDNPDDIKTNIREILEKSKGSNIINFSNYVDEIIDSQSINKILNLLEKKDLIEMIYLKNLLSNYNNCIKLFNKELIQSQKESIFEFSIISLVIIEREDFEKFEKEREKCPN